MKYVGVPRHDLIDVYKLFIRSSLEYCSVVFHSRLTEDQSRMLEHAQSVCLRVILDQDYENYSSSLRKCSLTTLFERRLARIDSFCDKAIKHPVHKDMFPISEKYQLNLHNIRNHEKFIVNPARTEAYKSSFIPFAQIRLNKRHMMNE